MRRENADRGALALIEAWLMDPEVQKGFCLGMLLGSIFIWGP